MSKTQFGFRKGKSTHDSLSIFITDIRLAFTYNESVTATFLDINSAYDNVLLPILKYKLELLQVPPNLCNFIIEILSDRTIYLSLPDSTTLPSRKTWKGLPQGSVLSPLLYNIYTYDLDTIFDNNVKILQYADDLLLYTINRSIEVSSTILTSALKSLNVWMDNNGLELSVSKCAVVVFSRKKVPPVAKIMYKNVDIPNYKEFKFLGIILDCKMTGSSHCEYVLKKAERIINMLRCLSGVWWGAHPFSLKLIYNALLRSIFDYGMFLLEPGNITDFKKLDKVQSKALRIISGAMRSSPINALQVELCESPLYLRRQFLSDRFLLRVMQFSSHPLIPVLNSLSEEMNSSNYWAHKDPPCLIKSYQKFLSLSSPSYSSNKLPIFSCSFDSLLGSPVIRFDLFDKSDQNIKHNFSLAVDTEFNNFNLIFTDASKRSNNECVGVGVFHQQYNIVQKIKLPPETSVFTGECFGLFKAVEYILLMKLKKSVIFCDSKSALQALDKFSFHKKLNHPIIFQTKEILAKCRSNGYCVQFCWVPGHCGVVGNEISDRAATDAVICGDIFPYKTYIFDLMNLPKIFLQESWQEAWNSSSQQKGKFFAMIQPLIPNKPWFRKAHFNKTVTSIIIRMRIGHVCTPVHLAKLHIMDSSVCECGEDEGNLDHIFLSCSLYDHSSLINDLLSLRVPFPTSMSVLLGSNDLSIYNCIASFIMLNNIKL